MVGTLFLGGGGGKNKSFQLDKAFADQIDKGRELIYIPIAINKKKHSYSNCLLWIKDIFLQFDYKKIKIVTDISNLTENKLEQASGLYIGGGNTFKLLHEFRRENFDSKLINYYKKGGKIYGGSAGAIILGKSIKTALHADSNNANIKNFRGLNLCNNFSIWCHYKSSEKENIKKLSNEIGKIIAIPEEGGIIIKNSNIENIGKIETFQKNSY